jgi:hypothetical protein
MASGGKKKTTMAKLNRESKLRERRQDKQARKDARKQAKVDSPGGVDWETEVLLGEAAATAEEQEALEPAVQAPAED